ncbi:MAG: hypothetical protein HOV81_36965 [Kofleriaceae bacterium]|nr:hypothetical protein [Kofleriaceae bacterium]
MPKLTGTLRDGSPFELSVNARTKRLRLYQHELATLDLAAMSAAPNVEILETGQSAIAIPTLAPLAGCAALTNLSLAVPAGTDLSPLASCSALQHLHLYLDGTAPCDVSAIANVRTLESLSISQTGEPPPIDLAPLAVLGLRSVSLSGITNEALDLSWVTPALESLYVGKAQRLAKLDLAPLARTKLRTLNLHTVPMLARLDLEPLGNLPLERVALYAVGVQELSLHPLASCASLSSLQLLNHETRFVDITPLAKLPHLAGLELDGKDAPFLGEHAVASIASPAVRAWHKAGRLTVE